MDFYKVSPTNQPKHPIPLVPVHLFPNKWAKPITIIALFDIGAHKSIHEPKCLAKRLLDNP